MFKCFEIEDGRKNTYINLSRIMMAKDTHVGDDTGTLLYLSDDSRMMVEQTIGEVETELHKAHIPVIRLTHVNGDNLLISASEIIEFHRQGGETVVCINDMAHIQVKEMPEIIYNRLSLLTRL